VITKPWVLSIKVTVPSGPLTPVALIALIVAVAVAAPAVRVPTKRMLAANKLKVAIDLRRNCMLVTSYFVRLLDGIRSLTYLVSFLTPQARVESP
jgi:hypothetical protein